MRLNLHIYRDEVLRAILSWRLGLDTDWDPFVAAWLAFALRVENGQLQVDIVDALSRWSQEQEAWEFERHLGPLSLLAYLWKTRQVAVDEMVDRIAKQLERMNVESKFSPLRDPEQLFFISLGLSINDGKREDLRNKVLRVATDQVKGPLKRRLLYAAAAKELGGDPEIKELNIGTTDAGDIIARIWWTQKYSHEPGWAKWWTEFETVKPNIVLIGEPTTDSERVLSISELAMLYEAITIETANPDPNMLFDVYPLHPRVREIAEKHFKSQSYVVAVEQATKVLNELIQIKSGVHDKSEGELVQATMKQIDKPRIRFNDFLKEPSGKNEQAGLALFAEGIFKAFRNPKGHKPEDHPLIQLDAYEALDELVAISYIMNRVKAAKSP